MRPLVFLAVTSFFAAAHGFARPSGAADVACPPDGNGHLDSIVAVADACLPYDCALPPQVVDRFVLQFNESLDRALAEHPEIRRITNRNVYELTDLGNSVHDNELAGNLREMLAWLGQQSARPSTIRTKVAAFANAMMGDVPPGRCLVYDDRAPFDLRFYRAWRDVRRENAYARAKNPRGLEISAIESAWNDFYDEHGRNLDHDFYLPVFVGSNPTLAQVRAALGVRYLPTISVGLTAVDDFAASGEGPEEDPAFGPIAERLKNAVGIQKRWYLSGGGSEWSSNVLLVLDEKGQAWGFQMGYSE